MMLMWVDGVLSMSGDEIVLVWNDELLYIGFRSLGCDDELIFG